jgi:hypothetical protein
MQEYAFKPSALTREQVWTIKDGHLLKRGGDKAVKLSDLKGATYGSFAYRGTQSEWLHLNGPGGETKLTCNMVGGPDLAAYHGLLRAVAVELSDVNPSLPIKSGGGQAYQVAMFIIGLLGAIAGIVFVLAGALGWAKRSEIMLMIVGAGMALSLGALAWSNAPWRGATILTPVAFLGVLGGA